ncbi:MAG: permease-like cell division protein FtsX [bacterium]
MNLTTLRIFKWGFINFWRNSLLSIAATLVMSLALLTVTISVIMNLVIGVTVDSINQKMDLVIYFTDEVSSDDLSILKIETENLEHVEEVDYISKNEALEKLHSLDIDKRLKDIATDENRLPRSFEITIDEPSNMQEVAEFFDKGETKDWVEDTSLNRNKTKIERLSKMTDYIRLGGILFSIVFVLIAVLIVYNTIRLTIFTRSEEIEIMKLVGASIPFIRWPLIIEGMLYGILGTIFSTGLIYILFYFASPGFSKYFGSEIVALDGSLLAFFVSKLWIIILLELFVGVLITSISGALAMKKHLNV